MFTTPATSFVDDEDRQALRALVRDVVADMSPPERVRDHDEREAFDHELFKALATSGLVQLEADRDGTAAEHRSQAVVLEELGATATSMAVAFVVQYMAVGLLTRHGTPDQQDRVLEPLCNGESIVSFALTEPDGGTDVLRAMRTRATPVDGGWRLTGAKLWISGATDASYLIVLARTTPANETKSAVEGITTFLVPRTATGVTVRELDTVAIHGLSTCEITLEDVFVTTTDVLGEAGAGFRQVISTLNGERLNAAAVAIGIARGALESAVRYATEREAFGRPIGAFQALQHKLVDGAIATESARLLLARATAAADAGQDATVLSAMAKVAASDAATAVTDTGMRVLGGIGMSREHPMQRYFRDARLYTFAPFTDEMTRNFIAERYLDLPRSY